jgi:hypothetical protein
LEDEINHFEQEIYKEGTVFDNIISAVDPDWNKLIFIVHYANKPAWVHT